MTKQQPNEQSIRRYRYHTVEPMISPIVRRRASNQPKEVQPSRTYVAPNATRRQVTAPQQAVQPLSWAERHARFRNPQAEQPIPARLVPRTFAQTGVPASTGRKRTNKPASRRGASSVVPARRKRGLSRFWRRLFGFLIILAVLGVVINFALNNPTFHVQQVHIDGTQNAGLIATIRQMDIQGQNIFLLNQAALLGHLEALPLVASAHLHIQLPNAVTVTIQERVPVLLWQNGHTVYGLAQNGFVIAPVSELGGNHDLVTVLDQRQDTKIRPGSRLDAAQVAFAQQLLQQLPNVPGVAPFQLQYVDHIVIHGQSEPANQAGAGCYIVVSTHGWQAYMGDAVNSNSLENRLAELRKILTIAQQGHIKLATIDLRFGLRPTYTVQL
ncbi:MAG: cell division protein FtsQ/DivIB [Ktedonobacteraceae bacterium]